MLDALAIAAHLVEGGTGASRKETRGRKRKAVPDADPKKAKSRKGKDGESIPYDGSGTGSSSAFRGFDATNPSLYDDGSDLRMQVANITRAHPNEGMLDNLSIDDLRRLFPAQIGALQAEAVAKRERERVVAPAPDHSGMSIAAAAAVAAGLPNVVQMFRGMPGEGPGALNVLLDALMLPNRGGAKRAESEAGAGAGAGQGSSSMVRSDGAPTQAASSSSSSGSGSSAAGAVASDAALVVASPQGQASASAPAAVDQQNLGLSQALSQFHDQFQDQYQDNDQAPFPGQFPSQFMGSVESQLMFVDPSMYWGATGATTAVASSSSSSSSSTAAVAAAAVAAPPVAQPVPTAEGAPTEAEADAEVAARLRGQQELLQDLFPQKDVAPFVRQ
jgi:hypothetical protein